MFQLKKLILTLLYLMFRRVCIFNINPVFQVISKFSVTASRSHIIQPTISLEMTVLSQGHYGFHSFLVID